MTVAAYRLNLNQFDSACTNGLRHRWDNTHSMHGQCRSPSSGWTSTSTALYCAFCRGTCPLQQVKITYHNTYRLVPGSRTRPTSRERAALDGQLVREFGHIDCKFVVRQVQLCTNTRIALSRRTQKPFCSCSHDEATLWSKPLRTIPRVIGSFARAGRTWTAFNVVNFQEVSPITYCAAAHAHTSHSRNASTSMARLVLCYLSTQGS